jgi:hypothetical protein
MMKVCQECKAQYEPARFDQKYCCNACRVRAHRRRTEPRTQTVTQTVYDRISPITGLPRGTTDAQVMQSLMAELAEMQTQLRLMQKQLEHERLIEEKNDQIKRLEREGERARGMGAVTGKLAEQLLLALAAKIGLGAKETPVTGNEVRPQAIRAEQVVFLPTDETQEPEQKPTKL